MVGGFLFKLTAKRVEYKFNIKRKITRITGESAAGKSELLRMLADSQTARSGVYVECRYKCRSIQSIYTESVERHIADICSRVRNHSSHAFESEMRDYLKEYDDNLIFADEDFTGMDTEEFALFCKFTDSFFVLICRNPLSKLSAFGCEIEKIMLAIQRNGLDTRLFLPENGRVCNIKPTAKKKEAVLNRYIKEESSGFKEKGVQKMTAF